jgi:hypothetical protein
MHPVTAVGDEFLRKAKDDCKIVDLLVRESKGN